MSGAGSTRTAEVDGEHAPQEEDAWPHRGDVSKPLPSECVAQRLVWRLPIPQTELEAQMTTEPKLPPDNEKHLADFISWGNETFNYGFHPDTWDAVEHEFKNDPTDMAWIAWQAAFEAGVAHAVAQRQGEPVAWVDVKDRYEGPYEFHGKELLDSGKHLLYTAPATAEQPAETREHILSAHIALSTCDGEGRVDKHHVQIAHEHIEAALGCLAATAPAPVAQAREITDAEIDALRKDAERYRWLRERDVWTTAYGGVRWCMEVRQAQETVRLPFITANYGTHLDAAIDAAIALANGRGGA